MQKLRVGIVGYGKMGGIRHSTIAQRDDAVVTAICDPFVNFADLDARGAEVCADWRDLIARDDVDAVIISCTNDLIPTVAVAALDGGRHVFCEKPPGRNPDDVEKIRQAAARRPDRKLKFGFNHRYHEAVENAHKLVASGAMGEILWMRGVYGKAGGPDYDRNWRNDPERSGGGILLDQGIHMVDLFHDFCGEFDEVKSFVGRQFWNVPVEDNAFALLRNQRGQVAMLHSSATQWRHKFNLEICLEEGFLQLSGILSSTMTYGRESLVVARCRKNEQGHPFPNPNENVNYFEDDRSWEKEMQEFVGAVRGGDPITIGTIDHAVAAMRAVYRIYEADPAWSPADLTTTKLVK